MRTGHLAVNDFDVARATLRDQTRQGHFRGIALQTEHRLAEENLAQLDSVQTPNQRVVAVGLHRVSESQLVQLIVGIDHFRIQPGIRT